MTWLSSPGRQHRLVGFKSKSLGLLFVRVTLPMPCLLAWLTCCSRRPPFWVDELLIFRPTPKKRGRSGLHTEVKPARVRSGRDHQGGSGVASPQTHSTMSLSLRDRNPGFSKSKIRLNPASGWDWSGLTLGIFSAECWMLMQGCQPLGRKKCPIFCEKMPQMGFLLHKDFWKNARCTKMRHFFHVLLHFY